MIPDWARNVFSRQSDEQLDKLREWEEARAEIENSRFYRMLVERIERELRWTELELKTVDIWHVQALQAYGKFGELFSGLLKQSKSGRFAGEMLSERAEKNRRKTVDEHMDEILGVRSER